MDQLVLMRRASKESTLQQNPTSTQRYYDATKEIMMDKISKT